MSVSLFALPAVNRHGFLVIGHIIENDQVCVCLVCRPLCCRGVPNVLREMAVQHTTKIRRSSSTFDNIV